MWLGNIDTLSALPFEGAGSGRVQPLQVGFHNLLPAAHKLASKLELLRGQNDNPAIQIPNPESSGKILLEKNYFVVDKQSISSTFFARFFSYECAFLPKRNYKKLSK
jgi:hypothetical protein